MRRSMHDKLLLRENLLQINEALNRIERRFSSISAVDQFLDSEYGLDMLDSICHDANCCWREF